MSEPMDKLAMALSRDSDEVKLSDRFVLSVLKDNVALLTQQRERIAELEEEISCLHGQLAWTDNSFSDIEGDQAALDKQMETMNSLFGKLAERVGSLERSLRDTEASVEILEARERKARDK